MVALISYIEDTIIIEVIYANIIEIVLYLLGKDKTPQTNTNLEFINSKLCLVTGLTLDGVWIVINFG